MSIWYPQGILDKFDFLIDGRAKKQIEVFIKKKPKFEEICKELEVEDFPYIFVKVLLKSLSRCTTSMWRRHKRSPPLNILRLFGLTVKNSARLQSQSHPWLDFPGSWRRESKAVQHLAQECSWHLQGRKPGHMHCFWGESKLLQKLFQALSRISRARR